LVYTVKLPIYIIRSFGWLTSQHCFIIGDGIYETTDSGTNWNEILELRNVGLRKFQSPKNYIGYAAGNLGLIYKYIDTTIVPVELTSFFAEANNDLVTLKWSTTTEINNSGFEVERKESNRNWIKIGFVQGRGTSSEKNMYNYKDENLKPGEYFYRLKQIDYDGSFEYSSEVKVTIQNQYNFNLEQNFPNPFNPRTNIQFAIPQAGFVTLKVYDVLGNEVATLVNEEKPEGIYEVEFKAESLSSGIYLYKLQAGSFIKIKKMLLLK